MLQLRHLRGSNWPLLKVNSFAVGNPQPVNWVERGSRLQNRVVQLEIKIGRCGYAGYHETSFS